MSIVIVKESSYDYKRLRGDVFDILSQIEKGAIKNSTKVLIKPNLLTSAREGHAITTHPLVIKAVTEYIIEKGAIPQISDSPATGSFNKIIKECGIEDVLKGVSVEIKEFKSSRKILHNGKFNSLEIADDALQADVIINLPKLKTHSQMGLTLAVKNLFGCVVGLRKPEWHYRVGENRELFAELLLTIFKYLKPSINLLDGILAMEGDGPGTGGTPRYIGLLIGSDDALPIDYTVCNMIGLKPLSLITNKVGKEMGLLNNFTVIGSLKRVSNFSIPAPTDLLFGPRFAQKFIRQNITNRPKSIDDICKLCNECVNICPAKAIDNKGDKLDFDYDQCIRCYCCLEVCPHGAMKIHEPFVGKSVKKLFKRF